MQKIKVLKTFKATPIGKNNQKEYDQKHIFEVTEVNVYDNEFLKLKDIHGGNDILMTKDYMKHLERNNYISISGKHQFKLDKE